MSHRLAALVAAFAAAGAMTGLRAQPGLADFFPTADSVTLHPPFRGELATLCQVKLRDRWVSFVGTKSTKTVLYAAVTMDSLADPVADVSSTVGFDRARPTLGKVSTWGYVFDRNRDGRLDYIALVGGAAPFEDGDFPPNFPRQGEQLMIHHVELYVAKCRIVFNHWADDNYDGLIDGVVQADMDPDREWVYRRILATSSKFDGSFDEVFTFRTDTSSFNDSISYTAASVPYRPIGMPAASFGRKELEDKSAVLRLLNDAAAACGRGTFRLPSGRIEEPGQ